MPDLLTDEEVGLTEELTDAEVGLGPSPAEPDVMPDYFPERTVTSPTGVPMRVRLPRDPMQSLVELPTAVAPKAEGEVTLSSPIGVPFKVPKQLAEQAGAALYNVAKPVAEFPFSPAGAAAAALPESALGRAIVQGTFGGLAAKGGGEALGEASVTGDTQRALEGGLMLGAAPFMAKPGTRVPTIPRWQGPLAKGELLRMAEGARVPDPRLIQLIQEGVPRSEANALLSGQKTVQQVVEKNLGKFVTPAWNADVSQLYGGHGEAWAAGYEQAIGRINAILKGEEYVPPVYQPMEDVVKATGVELEAKPTSKLSPTAEAAVSDIIAKAEPVLPKAAEAAKSQGVEPVAEPKPEPAPSAKVSPVWKKNTHRALTEGYTNATLGPVTQVDVSKISPSEEHGYASKELVEHVAAGKSVPPVVLEQYADGSIHIVDGSNRVNAAIKAGTKTVTAAFVKYADGKAAELPPRTPLDFGDAAGQAAIGDLEKMSPKELKDIEQTLAAYVGTKWERPPNPKSDMTANRMGTKALLDKVRNFIGKTVDVSAEVTPERKALPPPTPTPSPPAAKGKAAQKHWSQKKPGTLTQADWRQYQEEETQLQKETDEAAIDYILKFPDKARDVIVRNEGEEAYLRYSKLAEAKSKDEPTVDAIVNAAIKLPDGKINTGPIHSMVEGAGDQGAVRGYVTQSGRFVTMDESLQMPRKEIPIKVRGDLTGEEIEDPFRRETYIKQELESASKEEAEVLNKQLREAREEIARLGYVKKGDIYFRQEPLSPPAIEIWQQTKSERALGAWEMLGMESVKRQMEAATGAKKAKLKKEFDRLDAQRKRDLEQDKAAVEQAVREGKPVPAEVLQSYDIPPAEPGMAGPGSPSLAQGPDPRAQIEQLTDSFRNIEGRSVPLGERIRQAFQVGQRLATAQDTLSKAIDGLKASGNYLIGKWKQVQNIDDLLRAKGNLSAALESRGWRVREWEKLARQATPNLRDQAAIAKYVDAGGDPAELRRGLAETKPQFKQAYQDALNLSGDLKIAAENIRNYFDSRLQEAIDAGVLEEGVVDYIHRIYESRPKLAQKAIAYLQTGILQKNPALTKKRIFQFDWEAEKLGYRPVQSYITRIAQYESSLARAIAAREFIKKATTMKAADGRPVIDIKGVGIPIEDQKTGAREATLIKPQFNPAKKNIQGTRNYRGDYVNKEFPALSRWKWVASDSAGKPIFVQGDVAIHPDYVSRVSALLEPSRVRYGRYGTVFRPALALGSTVKQTMLDLSGFHQVQVTVHGLEHRVMPWSILQDIDFQNPNVDGLLKGGVTLGGEYRGAAEGLAGSALTRHIPILGPALESYHQWLFQNYIPRLKMTMALHALERNKARYAGVKSPEEIFHLTASEANAAFGEQNYIMLERSRTAQDMARLILLAPDFLEARGRFAGQALTRGGKLYGNEQRTALLLGALAMYTTARVLNKAVNGQYHNEPENLFSVVHNGKAYGLRTVQGDILHLIERPLSFWMHRLNPVYARTFFELATGRDEFGRRRSVPEQLWDAVSTAFPIALRTSRERSLAESLFNSFGVTARRWSDVDDAFTLARKWKAEHGVGERGEFIYDRDKDPLRPLKIALTQKDEGAAAREINKLLVSKTYTQAKLNDYFNRYATMPFTGSRANDRKFVAGLSDDEKKTVEAARLHKIEIRKLYQHASAIRNALLMKGAL